MKNCFELAGGSSYRESTVRHKYLNHNPLLAYSLCKTCMDLVCRRSTCNIGHFFEIWEIWEIWSGGSIPSDKWGARSVRPWDNRGGGGSGLQEIFFRSFGPHFARKIGGAGRKSSEILQTIVYKSLSNFANLWSHIFVSFQKITFKICIFANLKALSLAVWMDLATVKSWKNRGTDIKEPSTLEVDWSSTSGGVPCDKDSVGLYGYRQLLFSYVATVQFQQVL